MPITAKPAFHRADVCRTEDLKGPVRPHPSGRLVGVDLKAEVIHGYSAAEEGWFKSEGRGQFTRESLEVLHSLFLGVEAKNRKGLKSRFTHPGMSDDGLGKYLGRARDPWLDKSGERWKLRADLHISPSSHDAPSGDLGGYILKLAHEDGGAMSSSVVLNYREKELTKEEREKAAKNDEPPIWIPTQLMASDIVDTGDAVDDLLSCNHLSLDDLPDALQRKAWESLDRMFAGVGPDVVRARVEGFLGRYLTARFPDQKPPEKPTPEAILRQNEKLMEQAQKNNDRLGEILRGLSAKGLYDRIPPFPA